MSSSALKLIFFGLLSTAVAFGCGEASEKSGTPSNNAPTHNAPGNNQPGNNSPGDPQKSTFDVTLEGSGESSSFLGEVDNSQAAEGAWGAMIDSEGGILFWMSLESSSFSGYIQTTPDLQAPGNFPASAPPTGTYVVHLNPLAGEGFDSVSGTIRLDNCPTAVGQKLVGEFINVEMADAMEQQGNRTLNGSFDLQVFQKNGDLNCRPTGPSNNTPMNNTPTNNVPSTCDMGELCAQSQGACCPYFPCIVPCEFNCFEEFMFDPLGFAQCSDGCFQECNASQACINSVIAANACEEAAGCDEIEDEDAYEMCALSNCCDEIKAVAF